MNTNEDFISNQDNLTITPEIKEYLRESAKWGKLLSIVGFVSMAFLVLLAIFMGSALSTIGGMSGIEGGLAGGFVSLIYIVMAIIYFFPLLYLYRFSAKTKQALDVDDQHYLTEAFRNMKSLYKFMGIFTIVILVIYALIFGIALLGGMFSMM